MLACAGGASPEETSEMFNAYMAAKEFDEAAALTTCDARETLPGKEQAERRRAYAATLASIYDEGDLDYGRAEIRGRAHGPDGVVTLAVAYPQRSRPSAPPVARELTFKRVAGVWYYYLDETISP